MVRARLNSGLLEALLYVGIALFLHGCGSDSAGVQTTSGVRIVLTPPNLVLGVGTSAQLQATVTDPEGRPLPNHPIEWSSSAPEIASVSQTGVVTGLASGSATIGAYSEQSVALARAVVQPNFALPLSGGSGILVVTEIGTATAQCPGSEGGLRLDGSRDCSHAGVSRYSLDLADADQWIGGVAGSRTPEVLAAAEGTITDICLLPPPAVTCGPNGPFVQIEHPGGFTSIYAHLDPESVTLRRKTAVTRGQQLGTMGEFGPDHAPWLHFELRKENQGAEAAAVLDALLVNGRRLRDYRAGSVD